MKKTLILTALAAAGVIALVGAAHYLDLVGIIKRLHGM
jgi:energy-converting hydrogenase Eha subunit C